MGTFVKLLISPMAFYNKNLNHITSFVLNRKLLTLSNETSMLYSTSKKYIIKRLTKYSGSQQSKKRLIEQMNFQNKDDAAHFYNLPIRSLLNIYNTTKHDTKIGFCENRLYYIANCLKCDPGVLSNALSKRTFIYTLSPEWLQRSLNVLLEMGVPSDRIIRDLWVLKYHHETIKQRLQSVKDMGRDNLYPWMVRCSPDILNRSIQISKDTKDILGDNISTKDYLAMRLNTTTDVIEDMCVKIPYLRTIRVIKVKHFLDFLINEGFKEEEIVAKPRVLASSQVTITKRLAKLRSLGLKNINLNTLCRSRKDFKKYCETLQPFYKNDL